MIIIKLKIIYTPYHPKGFNVSIIWSLTGQLKCHLKVTEPNRSHIPLSHFFIKTGWIQYVLKTTYI